MRPILMLCLVLAVPAEAKTGNEVLAACQDTTMPANQTYCAGYIFGAVDMHNTVMSLMGHRGLFCVPSGVTAGQARAVFMKFALEKPGDLHHQADQLLMSALAEAFPCPAK